MLDMKNEMNNELFCTERDWNGDRVQRVEDDMKDIIEVVEKGTRPPLTVHARVAPH